MKITRILLAIVFAGSAIAAGQARTDIGTINGAQYRIDIPANWNHGLVVYCHGYSTMPVVFKDEKLPPPLAVFTEQGYALAESAYEATGWAIHEAVLDTEALRRYFDTKYGKPKETYVTGHSMGGSSP